MGGKCMESITVSASLEQMYSVLAGIGQLLERERCPENERRLMEISAEELFTNIASYAYGGDEGILRIEYGVSCLEGESKLAVVRFMDQGIPFDPFDKEDPDFSLPIEQRPVGGLGIYMVKTFMDRLSYRREKGWNITVMEKQFHAG